MHKRIALAAALAFTVTSGFGCANTCNDDCTDDAECDDDELLCISGKCAPRECVEQCSGMIVFCQYDRFCNFLDC